MGRLEAGGVNNSRLPRATLRHSPRKLVVLLRLIFLLSILADGGLCGCDALASVSNELPLLHCCLMHRLPRDRWWLRMRLRMRLLTAAAVAERRVQAPVAVEAYLGAGLGPAEPELADAGRLQCLHEVDAAGPEPPVEEALVGYLD